MEENTIYNEEQYTWARKFIAENEMIMRNNLLRSFLLKKENCFLLDQSIRYSTSDANRALDKAFQDHFAELRLISQLSNELRRHAIRYDQRLNLYRKRQLLILDQPIHENSNNNPSIVDTVTDGYAISVDEAALKYNPDLKYHIGNPTLYYAILSLTPRQKHILNASYLFNMTDTEIAAKEGVSQQSISKTKNKALKKLKEKVEEG